MRLRNEEPQNDTESEDASRDEPSVNEQYQTSFQTYEFSTSINYQHLFKLPQQQAIQMLRTSWKILAEDWLRMGYQDFSNSLIEV